MKKDKIESPCIKVCELKKSQKICTGCYRTLEEISAWPYLTDDVKERIIDETKRRKLIR